MREKSRRVKLSAESSNLSFFPSSFLFVVAPTSGWRTLVAIRLVLGAPVGPGSDSGGACAWRSVPSDASIHAICFNRRRPNGAVYGVVA